MSVGLYVLRHVYVLILIKYVLPHHAHPGCISKSGESVGYEFVCLRFDLIFDMYLCVREDDPKI